MKLHLLLHHETYEGETLLGIYDSAGKAEKAREVYLEEDEYRKSETLRIEEVSINEKADWNFTEPELQEYYKNSRK